MMPEDFPTGTKFFLKGEDVPVAVVPNDQAASWFGGFPSEWSDEHLRFSRSESKKEMVEISFAEFAKVVADSADPSKRLPVDHDDFLYCRPDEDGIWRDPDGIPI